MKVFKKLMVMALVLMLIAGLFPAAIDSKRFSLEQAPESIMWRASPRRAGSLVRP